MKRPLAITGFTYFLTLAAAAGLSVNVSAGLAVLLLLCIPFALFIKDLRRYKAVILALVTACTALCVFCIYSYVKIAPTLSLYNNEAVVSGVVSQEPWSQYGRYYYVVETDSIELHGAPQRITVRISCDESIDAQVSDRVTMGVKLFAPDGGGYSSCKYNYSKGIQLYAHGLEDYPVTVSPQETKTPRYYFSGLRRLIKQKINRLYSKETAALYSGILIGEKEGISASVARNFRLSGISHLLAVSGLHTVIIARFLMWLLCALRLNKKLVSALTSVGVIVFMGVAGFTPSVTRAGIMTVMILMSQLFSREPDTLNSLGFACLVLTAANPYAACDIGLQLSVAATLGLTVLTPTLGRYFSRWYKNIKSGYVKASVSWVCKGLSETLGATLFTLPITVSVFGELSLVSPVTNILCVYPSSLFMILGMIALILPQGRIMGLLTYPFVSVTEGLADYLSDTAEWLANLPFSHVLLSHKWVTAWICCTLVLFAATVIMCKDRKLYRLCAALSAIIFIVSSFSYQAFNYGLLNVAVVDVNNGCAVAVVKENRAFMINCGGEALSDISVSRRLKDYSVSRLEIMVLNDLDVQCSGASDKIIADYTPSAILLPKDGDRIDNLMHAVGKLDDIKLYSLTGASCNVLGGKLEIYTDCDGNSWNYYEYNDFSLLVCPRQGDASSLPDKMKGCDLLVIGSADIKGMEVLSPSVTVINADTKRRIIIETICLANDITNIYSTDVSGTVTVSSRGNNNITVREDF